MKSILDQAKDLSTIIVEHRRKLHQFAEVGFELPQTCAYVRETLEKLGYEPQSIGHSSLVATVGSGEPCILLRADMDALPMAEETGLPFAAKNGHMHSCGHDCHTAMLLGAAQLLKAREAELKGTVKLLFQAAEEVLEGAKDVVEAGVLENPHVDAAMMIHILSASVVPDGSVCFPASQNCYASADWFRVDVTGTGGHGAMPHTTRSAINTVCAINEGIQEIMAVVVPPSANAVMTVGEIHGGDSANIIPDKAYLTGTIRTYDEGVRQTIKEELAALVQYAAAARGTQGQLTFGHNAPPAYNDPELRREAMEALAQGFGPRAVVDLEKVQNGEFRLINASEDFAYIAEKVPSAIMLLSAGMLSQGYCCGSHNPKFDVNEDALYSGAATYVTVATSWLEKHKR